MASRPIVTVGKQGEWMRTSTLLPSHWSKQVGGQESESEEPSVTGQGEAFTQGCQSNQVATLDTGVGVVLSCVLCDCGHVACALGPRLLAR